MLSSNYDKIESSILVHSFERGFDLGYRGDPNNNLNVNNLSSAVEHPLEVNKALEKELKAGRIVGPFKSPPFKKFQISPIGVVPKKNGKFRMIVHLSNPEKNSINSCIDDVFAEVHYSSITEAINLVLGMGPKAFMAKSDVESAFRLLPIKPDQYHLLCLKWKDEYYVDRCLPMGARSSCALFEKFSTALEHIANRKGVTSITHYLDDFFLANRTSQGCEKDLRKFQAICEDINVPLSAEKTKGPTQVIDFLGFEIDSVKEEIRLPKDKVTKGVQLLSSAITKRKISLNDFQAVLGFLNFACSVIYPGRAFLQCLYSKTAKVTKPFHKITLNEEDKKDLQIWKEFLLSHNGIYLYREQLFLSPDICHFFSDSCGSLGMGAVFGNHWFYAKWPCQWYTQQNIVFLEYLPIIYALKIWGPQLKNKVIMLHMDNEALVHIINKQKSKEPLVRMLLRNMVLLLLSFNIVIKAKHLPGYKNKLADAISRLQITLFRRLHPQADTLPAPIPPLPESMCSSTRL